MLFGTGVVALLVGAINMMNIMLVTVTERTKEIGRRGWRARRAGWHRRDVRALADLDAGAWPVALRVELCAVALALGTAVVFGLFPALRAAKLDPVVALRSE